MLSFCSGRVPIYINSCFYKSQKLRYLLDVGGVSRDGRFPTELGTGSLRHAVGILTHDDFRAIVNSKISGFDVSKPCHFQCEGTEGSKQVCLLAWWTLEPLLDVAAVQETHFTSTADCRVLRDDFKVFSAFGSRYSNGVFLLVGSSLIAIVNLVFEVDGGQLVVADVAVKSFEFRIVGVHAPNNIGERCSFFRRLELFFDDPKWIILVGDWNAILDPKIDNPRRSASGLDRCERSLIDLMAQHDLIDRFRLDHPGKEMWMWIDSSPSARIRTYLDSVLGELTPISLYVPRSTR